MNRCVWCKENIAEQFSFAMLFYRNPKMKQICERCYSQLHLVNSEKSRCLKCEKISTEDICSDCMNWKNKYPTYNFKHNSLFYYNVFAREYMEKYKIMGDCELASLFATELSDYLSPFSSESLVVPIPISEASRKERGFNQVELLLESADIAYLPCLRNVGQGIKQSKKNRMDRLETRQSFELKMAFSTSVAGASIILVDDLYTTGRTLFHAADALSRYSPKSIQTFSLFR